tara:strand:+ start:1464 stop:2849 length:1386 start_codon:yes stop_codon:yes gene_type:complete
MENPILTISFYDLVKAMDGNFYDIYYPQKVYKNKKSQVKHYEKGILFYQKHVASKLSFPDERQSSLVYTNTTRLEKKWYHFVNSFFFEKMVSIVHHDLLKTHFHIYEKNITSEFVLVLPPHVHHEQLIHFYYFSIFSSIEPSFFIKIEDDDTLVVVKETYTLEYILPFISEINDIKLNFIRYMLNGLPPRYYPQFFHKNILNDHNKYMDGVSYGEISILFNCGQKIRKKCHDTGIYNFHDSDFLNQLSDKNKNIISRILSINSPENKDWKIVDQDILTDDAFILVSEKYKQNKIFYFDLEFTDTHLYLCGFYNNHNTYEYIWSTDNESFLHQFIDFCQKYKDHAFIFYSAEIRKIKEYSKKMNISLPNDFFENFIDLYHLLHNYCAFKNCYDFKLKNIVKSFILHQKIDSGYETNECQNGLDSIDIFENYILFKDEKDKQKLISYNLLDCSLQKTITKEIL